MTLQAAGVYFRQSSGKTRRVYAIEKLTAHFLQKQICDEYRESFNQMRQVTGFREAEDIVYKFLHRDEQKQVLNQQLEEVIKKFDELNEDCGKLKDEEPRLQLDSHTERFDFNRKSLRRFSNVLCQPASLSQGTSKGFQNIERFC